MKKIIIVCMLLVSLTGCSSQKTNVNSSEKESTVTSTQTQTSSKQETTPLKKMKISLCKSEQLKNATGTCWTGSNTYDIIVHDFDKKISRISSIGGATAITKETRRDERDFEFRIDIVGNRSHTSDSSNTFELSYY